MNLAQSQLEDQRRDVLTLLAFDSDYTLSNHLLYSAFEMRNKTVTYNQLTNAINYLEDSALVTVKRNDANDDTVFVTLTNSGLEIAQGKMRWAGVRNLRPSEVSDFRGQ